MLWLMGLMGTLAIWIVNASDISCREWKWTVPTTTYASRIVYWCDGDIPIITIYGEDEKWITMKAMNEWATAISYSNNDTNSYWNIYQWWNSYGFPSIIWPTVIDNSWSTAIDASSYAPSTYNNDTWIKVYQWDSWDNRNLWWGSWDEKNYFWVRWFDTGSFLVINSGDRQAMCPNGYHVPSAWERSALFYLWGKNYDEKQWTTLFSERNLVYLNQKSGLEWTWIRFSEDMQIPFAGIRNIQGSAISVDYGKYWSSSPRDDFVNSRYAYINPNVLRWSDYEYRANWNSIRCFKNEYVKLPQTFTISFISDGLEIVSWNVTSWEVRSETIPTPDEKEWYRFLYRYLTGESMTGFDFSTSITGNITLYAKWKNLKDIDIEAVATATKKTLKINKYFANAYTVNRWDGSPEEIVSEDKTHTYTWVWKYIITLSFTGTATRRTFKSSVNEWLVPKAWTTMTWVRIIYMPSLEKWFWANSTAPGNYFFNYFNADWALTSFPEWSFDTTKITKAGAYFFYKFNENWASISLPENSFDTSKISTVGAYFFSSFNMMWWLTSLPNDSFNTSKISTVGAYFFTNFNRDWQLTSLPSGSFDTSNISWAVGNYFFDSFNYKWQLTNLPNDSFNISNITAVGNYFFSFFNNQWQLTSLPSGSFDTSNISWSVGNKFFQSFNLLWQLTSLPSESFNTSKITTVGNEFFISFNSQWALTSLPEGSFDTSNITKVGNNFFNWFNSNWQITSLPEWSFDTSNITTVESDFLYNFNKNWRITDLPESFKLTSVAYNKSTSYKYAFNSTWYTLNRNVSDIVSWVTVPLDDRDTFSDNQPWRCGVHENRLVTTADACSISYDDGQWGTWEFKYNADTTWVEVWSGMEEPTRIGYTSSGWKDASWNKVDEIIFPDMDGQTLYANREINQYTITLDIDWTLTAITWDYGSPVNKPADPKKDWYTFKWWEPEIPDTMPAEDITIKAKWEKLNSSGWWGWWGGWSSSSSSTGSNATTGSDNSNNTWNQQTWSGANSSTGTQNEQPTSWTKINEPEANTGNNIQTWNQVDNSLEDSQSDKHDAEDSSANASEWQTYTPEFQQAYEFAKWHWITTMPTIQKADMNWKLTRIAMAKMLSQYAINVLWKTPDATQNNKFNDVTDKQNSDYDNGVTLAYQLGIMWQNMPNNRFRPNDEVTRAEFATALSRMIYKTSDWVYKSTDKYYTNHMEKLVEEWIITKDDPKMKELRWYVMIMLMRSAK